MMLIEKLKIMHSSELKDLRGVEDGVKNISQILLSANFGPMIIDLESLRTILK